MSSAFPILNIAAYRFVPVPTDRLKPYQADLLNCCQNVGIRGTILLSPEGINLFVAGREQEVIEFWGYLTQRAEFRDLTYKASYSGKIPFKRLKVKIKKEIIPLTEAALLQEGHEETHISPQQLKSWLDNGKNVTLLDTRNDYEVQLGKFKNARHLNIDEFRRFPSAVGALPTECLHQPIVLYCTGGIRCEKAVPLLKQKGFKSVYQLSGGILNYFEECRDAHFEGECFVFDERVALDSTLRETQTVLCDGCQYPVTLAQQRTAAYIPGYSCPHCADKRSLDG